MVFKLKSRSGFYVSCLLYYGILVLYFFGVQFLLDESNAVDGVWRYVLVSFLFALTAVLAMRIDLLWLSYDTHVKMFSGFSKEQLRSKGQFFGRVLAYYVFVFVATVALFLLRGEVYFLALYYMVFLTGSITMTYFDYLFPSYVRYRRNVEAGRW